MRLLAPHRQPSAQRVLPPPQPPPRAHLTLLLSWRAQVLPPDIRDPLVNHARRSSLLEVVLDLGRRPEARFLGQAGGEYLRDGEVRAAPPSLRCTRL